MSWGDHGVPGVAMVPKASQISKGWVHPLRGVCVVPTAATMPEGWLRWPGVAVGHGDMGRGGKGKPRLQGLGCPSPSATVAVFWD